MRHPWQRLIRLAATAALVLAVALVLSPPGLGDDWARDRAGSVAAQGLDPAIRAAITARSAVAAPVPAAAPSIAPAGDGFAWGAAALGLGAGIVVMCAVLACVSLMRSHGRLRNA